MAAYAVFIKEKITDPASMETYSQKAGASLPGHAVEILAAYGKQETLEGTPNEGVVILKFPTFEEAKAWYESPLYREAREIRFRSAKYSAFIVQGL